MMDKKTFDKTEDSKEQAIADGIAGKIPKYMQDLVNIKS